MPSLRVNRSTKLRGLKTFAEASRLCPELRGVELEYVDLRNHYVNLLAIKAQFDEELEQQKKIGDKDRIAELGNKMHTIQSKLVDLRERVRVAGERSWAEAFVLAADCMLPKEVLMKLNIAADSLIGRERHELPKTIK